MVAERGARKAADDKPFPWQAMPGMENPEAMSTRAERIQALLDGAFAAAEVTLQDDSHRHAGHAGARPGGETHYTLRLVSPSFAGLGRVARSRAVHDALAPEFAGGLHALSLQLLTPEEAAHGR
jgi:BolA protein